MDSGKEKAKPGGARLVPLLVLGVLIAAGAGYGLIRLAPEGEEEARAFAPPGLEEMALGSPDAPVTMIEYASFTCGHCAAFHVETLPRLQKDYIEPGKVRLIFRDYPLDSWAAAASLLARCVGEDTDAERFFFFIKILFENQAKWAFSNDRAGELRKLARLGGIGSAAFESCLQDQTRLGALQQMQNHAQKVFGVESTPTFFIEGDKIEGNQPYKDIRDVLDRHLRAGGN